MCCAGGNTALSIKQKQAEITIFTAGLKGKKKKKGNYSNANEKNLA